MTILDPILKAERAGDIHGVPGRFSAVTIGGKGYRDGTFTLQRWTSRPRKFTGPHAQKGEMIRVEVRFDDSCRNGHNSFAITGETIIPGKQDIESGGCIHDAICAHFPELARLIPWHLCASDGPMHYIANTVYHASDRDHWGRRAGEVSAWSHAIQFGDNPIKHKVGAKFWQFLKDSAPHPGKGRFDFEVIQLDHRDRGKPGKYQFDPKFTFGGFGDAWHTAPFETEVAALEFLTALQTCNPQFLQVPTEFSEGKARDLQAARDAAIWPEATDAELTQDKPQLTAALQARLPALVDRFKADIAATGLEWSPADLNRA